MLRMKSLGISVLRFSDHQVLKDMTSVLWEIEDFILKFEEQF